MTRAIDSVTPRYDDPIDPREWGVDAWEPDYDNGSSQLIVALPADADERLIDKLCQCLQSTTPVRRQGNLLKFHVELPHVNAAKREMAARIVRGWRYRIGWAGEEPQGSPEVVFSDQPKAPLEDRPMDTCVFDRDGIKFAVTFSRVGDDVLIYTVLAREDGHEAVGRLSVSLFHRGPITGILDFPNCGPDNFLAGRYSAIRQSDTVNIALSAFPELLEWVRTDSSARFERTLSAVREGQVTGPDFETCWKFAISRRIAGLDPAFHVPAGTSPGELVDWHDRYIALEVSLPVLPADPARLGPRNVRLVEEVGSRQVITPEQAAGQLWNSPPPVKVRYFVAAPRGFHPPAGIEAVYWNEEALEDFDLFGVPVGWRLFGPAAPAQLRGLGYEVQFVTREDFTLRTGIMDRKRAAFASLRENIESEIKLRQESEGRAYAAWKTALTGDLIALDGGPIFDIQWRDLRHVDKGVPGAWYTTGDHWLTGEYQGYTIYRRDYGNAFLLYMSPACADRMAMAQWRERLAKRGPALAAQDMLHALGRLYARGECYGDKLNRAIADLVGEDEIVKLAKSEPWNMVSYNLDHGDRDPAIAERAALVARFGIGPTIVGPPVSFHCGPSL